MFSKTFTAAAVALAASGLVSAQTHTDCSPLEKTCPSDAALGNEKVNCDWTKGACGIFEEFPGTTIKYDDKGALFAIANDKQAPTIRTNKYIFFGRVDITLQAANGKGVITSAVLQSDDLDEVDWEWVGGDNAQVQSNYFGKGDTTTYDRGAFHPVDSPLTTFHTYTLEWTSKAIVWSIDGAPVRTVTYDEAKGGSRFPQTPMEVRLGTWVAGLKGNPEGTVEWAGGITDFTQGPFNAWYKSVTIVDYAGGDGPASDAVKEYKYSDKSGSWESIDVVKGDGPPDDKPTSTQSINTSTLIPTKTTHLAPTTTITTETEFPTEIPTTSSKAKTTKTSTMSTITTPASSEASSTAAESSAAESSAVESSASQTGAAGVGATSTPSTTAGGNAPAQTTAAQAGASKGAMSLGGLVFAGAAVLLSQLL